MPDPRLLQGVVDGIVSQLAQVLALTSGQAVHALPAAGSSSVDWQVPLTVNGSLEATVTVGLAMTAAEQIAGILLGDETAPSTSDIGDTLKEIIGQAAAAFVTQDGTGLSIEVGAPVCESFTPPANAWQHDLVLASDDPPRLSIWATGDGDEVVQPSAAGRAQGIGAGIAAGITASPGTALMAGSALPGHRNMDVVLDLELPITVRFGDTRLTLDALARLGPGSLIDLDRSPDDPVELLVNGRLVARGEVVVVSGCYGVRVREVVSAADRLRSLEG